MKDLPANSTTQATLTFSESMQDAPANNTTRVALTFFAPSTDHAQKNLEAICRSLGLEIPTYDKMQPGARRRLPHKPPSSAEDDTYISIGKREQDNIRDHRHNPKNNKTRETTVLFEDASILLRCLHPHLPLDNRAKPTLSAFNVHIFTRKYGRPFTTHVRTNNGMCSGRMDPEQASRILTSWLQRKLADSQPFGWQGFRMTVTEIDIAVKAALQEWLTIKNASENLPPP